MYNVITMNYGDILPGDMLIQYEISTVSWRRYQTYWLVVSVVRVKTVKKKRPRDKVARVKEYQSNLTLMRTWSQDPDHPPFIVRTVTNKDHVPFDVVCIRNGQYMLY